MKKIQLEIYLRASAGGWTLPLYYNRLIQAAVYNLLDPELASFLHTRGFSEGSRFFKMFSFSLLQGVYQLNTNEKTICFSGEVKLTVTSPLHNFCQSLADGLGAGGGLRLGMGEAKVEKIETRMPLVEKEEVVVRTLSPVVLYSTFRRPEGKKYTVYFQPGDPDYDRLLHENLYNKYRAFYGTGPPAGQVGAKALGQQKKRIIDFNGTIIQGYSGKLILTGPVPLLQLALDGGLGGKNSQGFGCLEMI